MCGNPDARHNELAKIEQRFFHYPTEVDRAEAYLLGISEEGFDTYCGVHLYRERGRRLANLAHDVVLALWLDEDDGHFPDDGPEPTFVVNSSAGRRHLYWRLLEPIPTAKAVELNRRIAAWSNGDSGKAGCASVLRAPATYNYKRHPEIAEVIGQETGAEPWPLEVLEQAIPPLPEKPKPERRGAPARHPAQKIPLAQWLDQVAVQVLFEAPDDTAVTKLAIICPQVHLHTGGDRSGTYIGEYEDGSRFFFCYHEHCHEMGYRWFLQMVQPHRYVRFGPRGRRSRVFTSREVHS